MKRKYLKGTISKENVADPALGEKTAQGEQLRNSLTIMIPLFYNPDLTGARVAIEAEKLKQTEDEVRGLMSGYTRWRVDGWFCDPMTGRDVEDDLLRYEIDGLFDATTQNLLNAWRDVLEARFKQREIYFKFR